MLTDLYLLPLLSGQVVDMPNGELRLAPAFPPPYTMPVLISGCEGSITAAASSDGGGGVEYTLAVAFGSLKLPAGGLSVHGAKFSAPVDLAAGQSVSWTGPAVPSRLR